MSFNGFALEVSQKSNALGRVMLRSTLEYSFILQGFPQRSSCV
jgi:hypothetical protein